MSSYMRKAWEDWHNSGDSYMLNGDIPRAINPCFYEGFRRGRLIDDLDMKDRLELIEGLLSSIGACKEDCDKLDADELVRLESVIDLCSELHDQWEDMQYDNR